MTRLLVYLTPGCVLKILCESLCLGVLNLRLVMKTCCESLCCDIHILRYVMKMICVIFPGPDLYEIRCDSLCCDIHSCSEIRQKIQCEMLMFQRSCSGTCEEKVS